ncbi:MAG: hypothetical protein SOY65_02145 [Marinifilaceae bacterium]|nr:hypothetical protein [Marinifilaceae bacterium]
MKNIVYLFIILAFYACSKEEELTPTEVVKDWFVIYPGEGEWNEVAYQIYKDYGCSVFRTDTLGHEFRGFDSNGDSIIHYETLKIGYSIENYSEIDFTLCYNEEKLINGIKLIKEKLLPELKRLDILPRSYLLVDTIKSTTDSTKCEYARKDFETTLVGLTIDDASGERKNISDFTVQEQTVWIGKLMSIELAKILAEGNNANSMENFYALQKAFADEEGNIVAYGMKNINPQYKYPNVPFSMGYLEWGALKKTYPIPGITSYFDLECTNPSEEQDIQQFISAVLTIPEEEFLETYNDYPVIIEKYQWMKTFLQTHGYL